MLNAFQDGFSDGVKCLMEMFCYRTHNPDYARFNSLKGRAICARDALACAVGIVALPAIAGICLYTFATYSIIALLIQDRHMAELSAFELGGTLAAPVALTIGLFHSVIGILHPKAHFIDRPVDVQRRVLIQPPVILQQPVVFHSIIEAPSPSTCEAIPRLLAEANNLFEYKKQSLIEKWNRIFSNYDSSLNDAEKIDYRNLLIEIETIFNRTEGRILNDAEKLVVFNTMEDAFNNCIPSWKASLHQIVVMINEPDDSLKKISYWTDALKRQIIDEMAAQLKKSESRNVSNYILELIATDIGLDFPDVSRDPHGQGYSGYATKEQLLQTFYRKFTKAKIHAHLLEMLNGETRADLRMNLVMELAQMDASVSNAEKPAEAAYEKFIAKDIKGNLFNKAAVELLAKDELERAHVPEPTSILNRISNAVKNVFSSCSSYTRRVFSFS